MPFTAVVTGGFGLLMVLSKEVFNEGFERAFEADFERNFEPFSVDFLEDNKAVISENSSDGSLEASLAKQPHGALEFRFEDDFEECLD